MWFHRMPRSIMEIAYVRMIKVRYFSCHFQTLSFKIMCVKTEQKKNSYKLQTNPRDGDDDKI